MGEPKKFEEVHPFTLKEVLTGSVRHGNSARLVCLATDYSIWKLHPYSGAQENHFGSAPGAHNKREEQTAEPQMELDLDKKNTSESFHTNLFTDARAMKYEA